MMVEALAGAAIFLSGWSLYRVAKVDTIEDEVRYIRSRVDAIYDHLIGDRK